MKTTCSENKGNLRVGLYRCQGCGSRVEIFSDEREVRCYNCNAVIEREEQVPCVEWCALAHDCAGRNKSKEENNAR